MYVFKVLGTENWVDMLTKYLSAADLDKCMGMIDYYVRNDNDKKAVRKREVQMVVKSDVGVRKTYLRSAQGVLIAACMLSRAKVWKAFEKEPRGETGCDRAARRQKKG